MHPLDPRILVEAYVSGVFPMADGATSDRIFWYDPEARGILPLDRFHIPRRLRRTVRQAPYDITLNREFTAVMRLCAEAAPGREETWINQDIIEAYTGLHLAGLAHSVECRFRHGPETGQLAGGLYGVALGGAFFGESMVSRATDASKIALVHLVCLLRRGGFRLLDTQFLTRHLEQFGAREVTRADYHSMLSDALSASASFPRAPLDTGTLSSEIQSITQTS